MEKNSLSFVIASTGADLKAMIKFDDQEIFSGPVDTSGQLIQHEFNDETESPHILEITLQGKLPEHTQLDENNNITQDSLLRISGFRLDEIELKHLFFGRCRYHHDNNGSTDLSEHAFWGDMGCNGTVRFEFNSPVYLWLLENM